MSTALEDLLDFAGDAVGTAGSVALGYLGVPQAQAASESAAAQAQAAADMAQYQYEAAAAASEAAIEAARLAAEVAAAETAGDISYAKEVGSTGLVLAGIVAAATIAYVLVKK